MFDQTSRKLLATLATALTLGGAMSAFLAGSAEPAMALCKYGSPNCIHNGRPTFPTPGGAAIPPSNWEDEDCQQYSSCGFGNPGNWGDPSKRRVPRGIR
jgi:hypothetical protein